MPIDYNFPPKGRQSGLGWYDRGRRPHFEGGSVPQFFTFRLHDSVPPSLVEQWKQDCDKVKFRKTIEKFLDAGYGSCFLRDPAVADSLKFHDGNKYDLKSWVIMPNHLHFLVTPSEGVELATIAHSIKSYTAHEANKVLGRTGRFWQVEPFDRYIRNNRHYAAVIRYIENNPVKAGLCATPAQWRFSSAYAAG